MKGKSWVMRRLIAKTVLPVLALAALAAGPGALSAQAPPAPGASAAPAKPAEKKEPRSFLLLGLQLSPKTDGLGNMWVVSEGGDFGLAGPLLGGYEIGMFHRISQEKLEYRFKTFFNLKWELFPGRPLGAYIGLGGGVMEILRPRAQTSGFTFSAGMQGVVGFQSGKKGKDKLIIELQVLGLNPDSGGIHVHLMTGARF